MENLFSITFNSKNEKISKAYEDYIDAKEALIDVLREEGIEVEAKENTASGYSTSIIQPGSNWTEESATQFASATKYIADAIKKNDLTVKKVKVIFDLIVKTLELEEHHLQGSLK